MKELIREIFNVLRKLSDVERDSYTEGRMNFISYSIEDINLIISENRFAGLFFAAFGTEFFVTDDYRILINQGEEGNQEDLREATGELAVDLAKYLKMRLFFLKKYRI